LVNALLIYGVDPLDPASRAEGRLRAAAEIDRIVAWLARDLPGFERAVRAASPTTSTCARRATSTPSAS
jgi:hypothetical protein